MLVAPRPGRLYRDPVTKQLVPAEGFEADPADLDTDRALACGDLVPVQPKKAVPAKTKD